MILHEAAKNEDYLMPQVSLMPVTDWRDEMVPGPFFFSSDDDEADDDSADEDNFDDMDDDFEDDDFDDDDFD